MANLKHIGRLKNNKRKVVVPYRTIPNDPYSCLVIFVDTLSADEHDSLMKVTESAAGQQAYELAEVLNRTLFPDGRNMLVGLYKTGKLQKISTDDVEMIPNATSAIMLSELNQLIATQRGVALEDLSLKSDVQTSETKPAAETVTAIQEDTVKITETVAAPAEAVSPVEMAAQLRSQADAMFKEAKRLREVAESLVPAKEPAVKKSSVKKTESA